MTLDEMARRYARETGCTKEKAHEAACVAAALFADLSGQRAIGDYFIGRAQDFAKADAE